MSYYYCIECGPLVGVYLSEDELLKNHSAIIGSRHLIGKVNVMRVIICGDRHWNDRNSIENYVSKLPKDTVIIEGEAPGADTIARELGEKYGLEIEKYKAKWVEYGRAAGPIRNKQMLKEGKPDIVVAFHKDLSKSKGTANMVKLAREARIPVIVVC